MGEKRESAEFIVNVLGVEIPSAVEDLGQLLYGASALKLALRVSPRSGVEASLEAPFILMVACEKLYQD